MNMKKIYTLLLVKIGNQTLKKKVTTYCGIIKRFETYSYVNNITFEIFGNFFLMFKDWVNSTIEKMKLMIND